MGLSGTAIGAPAARAAGARGGWIISRKDDLIWFQGSVLAGLALLVLFGSVLPLSEATYSAGNPAVIALLVWGVCFDGTHVWATYARSYLAPDEDSRRALPGHWSWGVFAVGPAVALVDHFFFAQGPSLLSSAGELFRTFLVGSYLWAYWHLVRQHYGFLVLYRRKAAGATGPGGTVENALLWIGCLFPYLRYSLSEGYARSGLPVLVPGPWLAPLGMALTATFALLMAGGVALLLAKRVRFGQRHLLLAVVVGFHVLVFAVLDNLLAITATLTTFHNLQYHRIVWQYERGKQRVPLGGLVPYLALGLVFGLAWYGPRILGVASVESPLARNVLLGLAWGFAFHHYVVDGRIWRVRRHANVARALDAGA
jgi:hypothetical protein